MNVRDENLLQEFAQALQTALPAVWYEVYWAIMDDDTGVFDNVPVPAILEEASDPFLAVFKEIEARNADVLSLVNTWAKMDGANCSHWNTIQEILWRINRQEDDPGALLKLAVEGTTSILYLVGYGVWLLGRDAEIVPLLPEWLKFLSPLQQSKLLREEMMQNEPTERALCLFDVIAQTKSDWWACSIWIQLRRVLQKCE